MAFMKPDELSPGRKVLLSESCSDPEWMQKCKEDPLRVRSTNGLRPWLAFNELIVSNPAIKGSVEAQRLSIPLCVLNGVDDKAVPIFLAIHLYMVAQTPSSQKILKFGLI